MPGESNLVERLQACARRVPARVALYAETGRGRTESWTYAELSARVQRLAAGLHASGLRPNDRALVFIPMSPALYRVLLALWHAGAVAVFLDPWFTAEQIRRVCETVRPSWWFSGPSAVPLLWTRQALRAIPRRVITRRCLCASWPDLDQIERLGPAGFDPVPRSPSDTALVTFTSGTTGRPKGANRTHGFLLAQHRALETMLQEQDEDVDLSHFPIFALNSLAAGRTAVLPKMHFQRPGRVRARRMEDLLLRARVTTLTGSPAFLDAVAGGMARHGRTLSAIRLVCTGGGPVGARTIERIHSAFPEAEVRIVYGSTEAEPIAHIRAQEWRDTLAESGRGGGRCVGAPVPEIRTRLLGSDGAPADLGELWVAGPHVCASYVGDDEANRRWKQRDADGTVWHCTGDWVRRDASNRLWLLGRIGEQVVMSDGPVPLGAIEGAVETIEGVERAAALPLTASGCGAVALAWTRAPEDARTDAEVESRIRALFAERGWRLGLVRRFRRLPTDPRHNTKVDRARLARWLGLP